MCPCQQDAADLTTKDRQEKSKLPRARRLNSAERRALKAAEVQLFAKQYARRAQRGVEPNDRNFDREVELRVSRLDPEELDRLLRLGDDE
jgi:hypothetical protein